jgi:excinuclease ABC subunit C
MLSERRGGKVELRAGVRGDRARLLEMVAANADNALATELAGQQSQAERWKALATLLCDGAEPEQVECFDISHTQGEAAVASCVVFGPEGPRKSLYRRYNLRGIKPGDDYGAMAEALTRRLRNVVSGESRAPELLLIDGGAGQVNAVAAALKQLNVNGVRIVGIANGPERRAGYEALIRADTGEVLRPDAHDPGFHMVQRIRDEAHRFALGGHRGRRERARERSVLQDVPGIGAKRRSALLRHFGGMTGVLKAGVTELRQVPGINEELASRIHATLHGEAGSAK